MSLVFWIIWIMLGLTFFAGLSIGAFFIYGYGGLFFVLGLYLLCSGVILRAAERAPRR